MKRLILSVLTIAFSLAVVNTQATTILTSSDTTAPDHSQIAPIAFDMNAILDTDFTIKKSTPKWTFTALGGRLGFGDIRTFHFRFLTDQAPNHFPLSTGTEDFLEVGGDPSDLLASNWSTPIPEPATLLLFGTGLIGLARFGTKKRQ